MEGEWNGKLIRDFWGNKSYVSYLSYGGVLEVIFYVIERDRNGLWFRNELAWRILRETNVDGTYDLVAITETDQSVDGLPDETLPTGIVLYERMSQEEWRKLVFSYLKGDFIRSLEREFERAKQIDREIRDGFDKGEIPSEDCC